MKTASDRGSWSKDRSRKIGACIVNIEDQVDVSTGWNGFARGVDDNVEERHQRPEKYLWSEHAERNAFYNAARLGRATKGCHIYQTMFPCCDCARGIIQCGIVELITVEPDYTDATYGHDWKVALEMLTEAGVRVRYVDGVSPTRIEVIQ